MGTWRTTHGSEARERTTDVAGRIGEAEIEVGHVDEMDLLELGCIRVVHGHGWYDARGEHNSDNGELHLSWAQGIWCPRDDHPQGQGLRAWGHTERRCEGEWVQRKGDGCTGFGKERGPDSRVQGRNRLEQAAETAESRTKIDG